MRVSWTQSHDCFIFIMAIRIPRKKVFIYWNKAQSHYGLLGFYSDSFLPSCPFYVRKFDFLSINSSDPWPRFHWNGQQWLIDSLQWKYYHYFNKTIVTCCTRSCRNDSFWCNHWWNFVKMICQFHCLCLFLMATVLCNLVNNKSALVIMVKYNSPRLERGDIQH